VFLHALLLPAAALWTSVFNFASELDQTHDAYAAALSNPLPERAAEAVRRLVQALVDRGQLQQLLSLPWAGVLVLNRNGLQEPVPVVEVRSVSHFFVCLTSTLHVASVLFALACVVCWPVPCLQGPSGLPQRMKTAGDADRSELLLVPVSGVLLLTNIKYTPQLLPAAPFLWFAAGH
jgi:hypothetical protein